MAVGDGLDEDRLVTGIIGVILLLASVFLPYMRIGTIVGQHEEYSHHYGEYVVVQDSALVYSNRRMLDASPPTGILVLALAVVSIGLLGMRCAEFLWITGLLVLVAPACNFWLYPPAEHILISWGTPLAPAGAALLVLAGALRRVPPKPT